MAKAVILLYMTGGIRKKLQENDKEYDTSRQICPRCKTGAVSYQIDNKSVCCPHIWALKTNTAKNEKFKCLFFKKINNT